ncbi:MAG: hypothetical protein M1833_001481 [Piccolia ochrophora]|nr:MAG: hypothetical protein M1833_001481 [Piccolia ochrophora]
MDAAIRWSPHSTKPQQRFLILNLVERSIKLHQIDAVNRSSLDYHQISQHNHFPNVRAFDWSPTDEAVVAVGLPTGEASLLRVDDDSNEVISFSVKNQRLCNAIALSTKNLLASGLDKVRNDFCLNIWDINHRLSTWNKSVRGWGPPRAPVEPIRKLATSETISSIKFFTDQPDSLVAGVKGQVVRIYDLRDSPGNAAVQFATRCTHNLSIDACDENYIASASSTGDPVVCVWDRRVTTRSSAASLSSSNLDAYQAGAVLELRNFLDVSDHAGQQSIWSVRYSKSRRGCLGILSNQGQLTVYETARERFTATSFEDPQNSTSGSKASEPLRTKTSFTVQHACFNKDHAHSDRQRVVSFDFMNSGGHLDGYRVLAYRSHGAVEVFDIDFARPLYGLGVNGRFVVGDSESKHWSLGQFQNREGSAASSLKALRSETAAINASHELHNLSLKEPRRDVQPVLPYRQQREKVLSLAVAPGSKYRIGAITTIGTIEQRRADEGYLFTCSRNVEILADDPALQDLWRWVAGAQEAADNGGMMSDRLDLSFLGVNAIWEMDLGFQGRARLLERGEQLPSTREFSDTIATINKYHDRPRFQSTTTRFPEVRQLCLAICGWAMSAEEFETELHRIQREETTTKAAAWALFHGQPKRAVEAVYRGTDSEKLVAMAIAGYYNMVGLSKQGNEEAWAGLCREIGDKATDPYSRAILALVSSEDWKEVIAENSLPLRDRIGVAMMFLADAEITPFLSLLTRGCVENGDIEGICLTGLTSEGMDLFQTYIDRTGDVQTAVLVMSHGAPYYIDDFRFFLWRTDYCQRLNKYKLHVKRALYETRHIERSQARDGSSLIKSPPRQVSVRCISCDQSLVHNGDDPSITANMSSAMFNGDAVSSKQRLSNPLNTPSVKSGTACSRCGRRLPRCAVCMMWLGVPNPRRAGGATALEEEDPMERFMNFCNICHHGYHARHARQWFEKHQECPVPECECLCAAREAFG